MHTRKRQWLNFKMEESPVIVPRFKFVVIGKFGLPIIVPAFVPEVVRTMDVPTVAPAERRPPITATSIPVTAEDDTPEPPAR